MNLKRFGHIHFEDRNRVHLAFYKWNECYVQRAR